MKQADLQHFGFLMHRYVLIVALFVGGACCKAATDELVLAAEVAAAPTPVVIASAPVIMAPSSKGLVVDAALTQLSGNMDLSTTSSIFFRGKSATTMTFDGQGFYFQMPRASVPFLQVAASKNVVLKNIVLKDFSQEHLKLLTSATCVFGDNVYIELASSSQALTSSWVFDGAGAIVDGRGGALQLGIRDAILINDARDLTFKNIRLLGCSSTGTTHRMRCAGAQSTLIFDDSTLMIDSLFNLTQGNVVIRNDVTIKGVGGTLAWTSAGTLRLDAFACLKFDYGSTFSYDAALSPGARNNFVMSDDSSLLYLNNARLHATRVGMTLARGSMYFENIVTLESEAQTAAEALVLDKSLQAFVPNGSTIDVRGKVVYQ